MRARQKSKGGSSKGAAYHQMPSSASYDDDDNAPELVLIDMNSSSDTSSSSSKSKSSKLHDDYGDELALCKLPPPSNVAKSNNGNIKKAYNLEQIEVPQQEPAPFHTRYTTTCHVRVIASFTICMCLSHSWTTISLHPSPLDIHRIHLL
jgi:hypothetical protein